MPSSWTAGFGHPWIVWDGVEGDGKNTGEVLVDGLPVPATFTRCDVAAHSTGHRPDHDHCIGVPTRGPFVGQEMEPAGISFGFHLENGLVLIAMVADDTSVVTIATHHEMDGAAIDLVRVEGGFRYAEICSSHCCVREDGTVGMSWHLGWSRAFESRQELLAHLLVVSHLEVRHQQKVVREAPPAREAERSWRDGYGTITLEEWRRLTGADGG